MTIFGTGKLNNAAEIHQKIFETINSFGKGIYFLGFVSEYPGSLKNEISIGFTTTFGFLSVGSSIEETIENQAILGLAARYDPSCEYYTFFQIDTKIVGGTIISINQPAELESAIGWVITYYNLARNT